MVELSSKVFELTKLTKEQINLCQDTISSNTFHMIVGDALLSRKPLSVVRMGDGEKRLWVDAQSGNPKQPVTIDKIHTEDFLSKLGCLGISKAVLQERLLRAARECTYFAPSVSGIIASGYDNYSLSFRNRYVDNFFVNSWDDEMILDLFKQAGRVLLIHAKAEPADAMQIRAKKIGVEVTYLKLASWQQSEKVIAAAKKDKAQLVLFSAGPASKYIGPVIAKAGNKVALDVGNSVDRFTLSNL